MGSDLATRQGDASPDGGTALSPAPEGASELAFDILDEARLKLLMAVRFLDAPLWAMPFAVRSMRLPLGTDGRRACVDPLKAIRRYRESPDELARDLLHAVLHCSFGHPFDGNHPDKALWDAACDIAAESCAINLVGLRFRSELDDERRQAIAQLREACPQITAPNVYRHLVAMRDGDETSRTPGVAEQRVGSLARLFLRDDHGRWPHGRPSGADRLRAGIVPTSIADGGPLRLGGTPEGPDAEREGGPAPAVNMAGSPAIAQNSPLVTGAVKTGDQVPASDGPGSGDEPDLAGFLPEFDKAQDVAWEEIGRRFEANLQAFMGKPGIDRGSFSTNMAVSASRKRYDYRSFLRTFASLSEELKVSTEEFDYIYYSYGLQRYSNMPLIEPLEYQESRRVRDFVIAIDTSASCAGSLVRHFVEKTYDVLRSTSGFGRKINVHVVQCDCAIRSITKITQLHDLDEGFADVQLRGFGGTDFRPVFEYVDELVAMRELQNLKGMIYLTDGMGTYPERPPDYDCAFVFVGDAQEAWRVPPWAMKVVMSGDQVYEL